LLGQIAGGRNLEEKEGEVPGEKLEEERVGLGKEGKGVGEVLAG